MFKRNRSAVYAMILGSVLALSACGGSSSDDDSGGGGVTPPDNGARDFEGRVLQTNGLDVPAGSFVFLDLDNSGTYESNEPMQVLDADGSYVMDYTDVQVEYARFVPLVANIPAESGEGAYQLYLAPQFDKELKLDDNFVSPLTTEVFYAAQLPKDNASDILFDIVEVENLKISVNEADALVSSSFGISVTQLYSDYTADGAIVKLSDLSLAMYKALEAEKTLKDDSSVEQSWSVRKSSDIDSDRWIMAYVETGSRMSVETVGEYDVSLTKLNDISYSEKTFSGVNISYAPIYSTETFFSYEIPVSAKNCLVLASYEVKNEDNSIYNVTNEFATSVSEASQCTVDSVDESDMFNFYLIASENEKSTYVPIYRSLYAYSAEIAKLEFAPELFELIDTGVSFDETLLIEAVESLDFEYSDNELGNAFYISKYKQTLDIEGSEITVLDKEISEGSVFIEREVHNLEDTSVVYSKSFDGGNTWE